jgi:PTH2 family peptidyl-tRNA hydrolase
MSYKNNKDIKQVIVMRKDLKCRRGKEIAQGSHASMKFLVDRLKNNWFYLFVPIFLIFRFSKAEREWLFNGSFRKICLIVDSEGELMHIHNRAKEFGLTSKLITDSGKTEFKGIPTNTCLAIGPDYSELIDKVTGDLKLY